MKQKLMIMMVFTWGLGLAACSKSTAPAPAPQQGGQTGPAWSLSLKTKCLDGSEDTCVGYYGFSVDASGKYTVGGDLTTHPARVRTLATDENHAITDLLKPYLDSLEKGTQPKETCTPQPADRPSLDNEQTLTLNHHGTSFVLAHETAKDSCVSLLDAKSAHAIEVELGNLATAHYPSPYPDPCLDQIDQFESQYTALQKCSVATDCAYIGDGFAPIPYDASQIVFMEDYTKLTPIVVANASKVTAQKDVLNTARTTLEQSCGDGFLKDPVPTDPKEFNSNAGNPICDQGVCKVNPAVFSRR